MLSLADKSSKELVPTRGNQVRRGGGERPNDQSMFIIVSLRHHKRTLHLEKRQHLEQREYRVG